MLQFITLILLMGGSWGMLSAAPSEMCSWDCDLYAESQNSGAFPQCLYNHYACGEYQTVVDIAASVIAQDRPNGTANAPVIDPTYRYLWGAAYYGLHVRNFGVKPLQCEYRQLATRKLTEFLTDSRDNQQKTGSYGIQANTLAFIAHSVQMLEDLALLKGCPEAPLNHEDIQRFARQYARDRVENAFLSDAHGDATAEKLQTTLKANRDVLRSMVTSASHLEGGLAVAEVQRLATTERLQTITADLSQLAIDVHKFADTPIVATGPTVVETDLCTWIKTTPTSGRQQVSNWVQQMCDQVELFKTAVAGITPERYAAEQAKVLRTAMRLIADLKFKQSVYTASVGNKAIPLKGLVERINQTPDAMRAWRDIEADWIKVAGPRWWGQP